VHTCFVGIIGTVVLKRSSSGAGDPLLSLSEQKTALAGKRGVQGHRVADEVDRPQGGSGPSRACSLQADRKRILKKLMQLRNPLILQSPLMRFLFPNPVVATDRWESNPISTSERNGPARPTIGQISPLGPATKNPGWDPPTPWPQANQQQQPGESGGRHAAGARARSRRSDIRSEGEWRPMVSHCSFNRERPNGGNPRPRRPGRAYPRPPALARQPLCPLCGWLRGPSV